ncbi:uncharacterized protein LOC106169370 isoform X2 [Lingula anatina]|nr:uncharacterized protein LOC106169370 isoform X2 [Lingula anatina]|eukprot:XP_013404264.1 uncharacterized protein LOC106169370 isoform X2 [Lingula anatina]
MSAITKCKIIGRVQSAKNENEENDTPGTTNSNTKVKLRPPFTPIHGTLYNIRQRLEERLSDTPAEVEDKTSPGLARLRKTPACIKARQQSLIRKHQVAKDKIDNLNVGGGVSMWPQMETMRLTQGETLQLLAVCIGLFTSTVVLFYFLHGSELQRLKYYDRELHEFYSQHPLVVNKDNYSFTASVLKWHTSYGRLLAEIQDSFAISLMDTPWSYKLCVLLYVCGIGILLYYLMDNMVAKSKLTPRRIKKWVSLLTVTATWTLLMLKLLIYALRVELAVESNVHMLMKELGQLIPTDLDLGKLQVVLQYWSMHCFPPTSQGVLNIMGILSVRDVTYYLQYYSLPIVTALVTPVLKLVVSLKEIYSDKKKT